MCPFCTDEARQKEMLCIVASPKDVFQIEETGIYRGLYHVLGALLSPISGIHEEGFDLAALKARIQTNRTKEVIFAIDATLEGDATALYLREMLEPLDISITRLALGLPIGSPLDFIDGGTLSRAITQRNNY